MAYPKNEMSAATEAMRLGSLPRGPFDLAPSTGSLIDKSMRETRSLAALAGGRASELSAVDKALGFASGMTDTVSKCAAGSYADKTMRDILKAQFDPFEAGRSDALADAVRGIKGIDDKAFAGVKTGLDKYETAAAALRDQLANGYSHDPLSFAHNELRTPELPPMPRNPILKTNELLDEMVDRQAEQHALIGASAEAQKRETELLAQLVEAFTTSQAESDRATRRAQMQAWIGIGVAVATGVAPLLIMLFSGR